MSQDTKQYVILDSNIIQNFANSDLAAGILSNLREAQAAGYRTAISDFTFFEMLDSITMEKESVRISAMRGIKRFYVKKNVLVAAAHLGCIYKENKHTVNDIGDKIIGATSILTNSIIYTTNPRDFPRPFFDTMVKRELRYEKKGFESVIGAYFLKPDMSFIGKKYDERVKPYELKIEQKKNRERAKLQAKKNLPKEG